ncbi:hypothetical protein B5X24_HaOG215729 [Helicoverpa armigera]|nr:hypothetical protein B5X24_HaOG215729 [Helicoverpa armigera]
MNQKDSLFILKPIPPLLFLLSSPHEAQREALSRPRRVPTLIDSGTNEADWTTCRRCAPIITKILYSEKNCEISSNIVEVFD